MSQAVTPPESAPALSVSLWGTFLMRGSDGTDLTPRLAKCQALVALLATAQDGVRTRSWLQAKLWSDRSKEQANGSLRQALADIRRRLGPDNDLLIADRKRVRLDLDRVVFSRRQRGDEFLAGLDVRDDEFEDWLRLERTHREDAVDGTAEPIDTPRSSACRTALVKTLARPDPVIVLSGAADQNEALSAIKLYLIDSVARSLRESFALRTYTEAAPAEVGDALVIGISATLAGCGQLHLAARCQPSDRSELIWSGHQTLKLDGAFPFGDLNVLSWVNEIVAAIADHLSRPRREPSELLTSTQLGLSALRELFSLETARVDRADRLLLRAHEVDPRPVFTAWRAQLKAIQIVERHSPATEAVREEGLALAREALEGDPGNASVLAAVANARLILDGDAFASETLSRRSVELSPGNPLAWWSRAFSHLYCDRPTEALEASERGYQLSRGSPYRFWWEMQTALSATAAHRFTRAALAAERSAVWGSDCRPSMRYLVGLHAREGAVDRAVFWADRLARLESDFTPDRLLDAGGYPASLLTRYSVLSPEHLKPVIERAGR